MCLPRIKENQPENLNDHSKSNRPVLRILELFHLRVNLMKNPLFLERKQSRKDNTRSVRQLSIRPIKARTSANQIQIGLWLNIFFANIDGIKVWITFRTATFNAKTGMDLLVLLRNFPIYRDSLAVIKISCLTFCFVDFCR